MGRRSLQASKQGIQAIKKALKGKKWSQTYLAGAAGCSRQTIWSLLQGNPTDCDVFMEVCNQLGMKQEEIAEPEITEPEQDNGEQIDALVQAIRESIRPYIQERCGMMRVLDMEQPIGLGDIYTSVNILERITGRRGLDISELMQNADPEQFDRFCLGKVREKRVPGLEAVEKFSKLMILGKPGAGKTTFLKHLAMQCIGGKFQRDRVPIFITLKDFAEADEKPNLLTYIERLLLPDLGGDRPNAAPLHNILRAGKALILLDGLDEVREADNNRVLRQIREFSEQFPQNQFVITCRIAAQEYTFERFTEVEIADFNDEQIYHFASRWFYKKSNSIKVNQFLQKLRRNAPIRELANSPLLLALLCLVFEDSSSFPDNRTRLYERGIDRLLRKWNLQEREYDPIYKKLSSDYREDLLGYIAWRTFENGTYFFRQREIGKLIREYFESLSGIPPEDLLKLDSKTVLSSIEVQHGLLIERAQGIWSFSHLTFQEYFVARQIHESGDWKILLKQINEKYWREIFLLVAEMVDADEVSKFFKAIKSEVDKILALERNPEIYEFMTWVKEKASQLSTSYKSAAIRALYFDFTFQDDHLVSGIPRDFAFKLDPALASDCVSFEGMGRHINLGNARSPELATDNALISIFEDFAYPIPMSFSRSFVYKIDLCPILDDAISQTKVSVFQEELKQLREQLPKSDIVEDTFEQWWFGKGQSWINQFRNIMIKCRKVGYTWRFTGEQKRLLGNYYDANKLLIDCLAVSNASQAVRQEIEGTLLLPIAEIEKRKQQHNP
jgi:predicted NACHT family NTPase